MTPQARTLGGRGSKIGHHLCMILNIISFMIQCRAVFSFLNPGVFVVIAKLQKAEIRLRPFPEPQNSGGALAPPASPLSRPLHNPGFYFDV